MLRRIWVQPKSKPKITVLNELKLIEELLEEKKFGLFPRRYLELKHLEVLIQLYEEVLNRDSGYSAPPPIIKKYKLGGSSVKQKSKIEDELRSLKGKKYLIKIKRNEEEVEDELEENNLWFIYINGYNEFKKTKISIKKKKDE